MSGISTLILVFHCCGKIPEKPHLFWLMVSEISIHLLADSIAFMLQGDRTSWWRAIDDLSCSPHGSQEAETEKSLRQGIAPKDMPVVTYFLHRGPHLPKLPSPPNNNIKLRIHQWINPLIRSELSPSNYLLMTGSTS
jgi:hypothetical protein